MRSRSAIWSRRSRLASASARVRSVTRCSRLGVGLLERFGGVLAFQRVGDVVADERQQFLVARVVACVPAIALHGEHADRLAAPDQRHAEPARRDACRNGRFRPGACSRSMPSRRPAAPCRVRSTYSVRPWPSSRGWRTLIEFVDRIRKASAGRCPRRAARCRSCASTAGRR